MDIWSTATTLFLSVVLGGVIGLEREVNEKKADGHNGKPSAIVGLRSFSFIALLGAIVGLLYANFIGLSLLIGSAFLILLLSYYIIGSLRTDGHGITTELGMIFSFVIGIILALKLFPIQLVFALTIVVILLLSQKEKIKNVVEDIRTQEINAFVSFALIAIVILPFLPNTSYAIADIPGIRSLLENFHVNVQTITNIDIINPFSLWLIVALITGVDLIGYILEKTLGTKKGWLIASAVGGFVSSTATTLSLAQESKHRKQVNPLISAALLSNLVSFFQIAILIGALNAVLLLNLTPVLGLMILSTTILVIYFLRATEGKPNTKETVMQSGRKGIINLPGALKFAAIYVTISILSKIALAFFGNSGFLITTGIGALVGLDAVMINTAQLAGSTIDYALAAIAFIIANAVNLFGKTFFSFLQGKKEFAVKLLISFAIIITSSLAGLFFII
ncbi:MAG: MgtC/SapB family protein [Candidatus Levybacteria bacterium]|nr:MgtC/SapB family protein [Candidatus Levybacteria bacterium]